MGKELGCSDLNGVCVCIWKKAKQKKRRRMWRLHKCTNQHFSIWSSPNRIQNNAYSFTLVSSTNSSFWKTTISIYNKNNNKKQTTTKKLKEMIKIKVVGCRTVTFSLRPYEKIRSFYVYLSRLSKNHFFVICFIVPIRTTRIYIHTPSPKYIIRLLFRMPF